MITNKNNKIHKPNWLKIPNHSYQVLFIGRSGSRKTNALLHLINYQPEMDKHFLFTKDPYEPKYQLLSTKGEQTGLKHSNDPRVFI